MKGVFLGTNGFYSTKEGDTSSILIQADNFHVVLDAGNGIRKLDQYVNDEKPIHIFLSHLHLDHISGFHPFAKFKFKQRVTVYVPKGYKTALESIVKHPFMTPFLEMKTTPEIVEIEQGNQDDPFSFEALSMEHVDAVLGYRLNIDGKVISYSGDTAICENSKKLAQGADLLIHECSILEETNTNWGHAKPSEAATLAKDQGVKQLALTHFDPVLYLSLEAREKAGKIAKEIFPNTIVATDGLELNI